MNACAIMRASTVERGLVANKPMHCMESLILFQLEVFSIEPIMGLTASTSTTHRSKFFYLHTIIFNMFLMQLCKLDSLLLCMPYGLDAYSMSARIEWSAISYGP